MIDPEPFLECKYGGLRLFASRIEVDTSRTQVVHEFTDGDDYVVQDRGKRPMRVRAELLFDWMDADDLTPRQRMAALQEMNDKKERIFTHPTKGSFLARIGDFHEALESTSVLTASIEFIRTEPFVGTLPGITTAIPGSGPGAVSAAAEGARAAMADIGMPSSVADDAIAKTDAWTANGEANPREVLVDTGSLTSRIGDEAGGLESDLGTWEAFKANINLADAVHEVASSAIADNGATFSMRLLEPIAARSMLAGIYGADEADVRYDQFLRLNDVDSPAWLDPSKIYHLPALVPQSRS